MSKNVKQVGKDGRNWYVLHTYSGYEDAVEKALKQRIETLNMQDFVFDVQVPKEPEFVIKKGKVSEIKKRIFPGYVLVDMIVTDESWYIVRNTPNITGFVGSGNIPIPVSADEFGVIQDRIANKNTSFKIEFEKGDLVKIMNGPFASYEGLIKEIDKKKGKVKVFINIFDRETSIELDFDQITKK